MEIAEILQLPLTNDILENMENKTKLKPMRNNILAKVDKQARDKVLALIIKNPGLLTRRYNQFIDTTFYKKCPYCGEESEQLVFH